MPASGVSRAAENRRIRQEALREQLQAGGHLEHVIDIAAKMQDLDNELGAKDLARLKAAADIKLALLKKYIPDLKSVDLEGDLGVDGELKITWQK